MLIISKYKISGAAVLGLFSKQFLCETNANTNANANANKMQMQIKCKYKIYCATGVPGIFSQ